MKRMISILLILLLVTSITGCKKPETYSIYTDKGDIYLKEKILTGNVDNTWIKELIASNMHINQTFEHGTKPIKFIVDAEVFIQTDHMPSAAIKPHRFTQEEVDRIVSYLVGDAYFADLELDYYDSDKGETVHKDMPKPFIAIYINYLERVLPYYIELDDSIGETKMGLIEKAVKELKEYKEKYLKAKEISEFPSASRKLGKNRHFVGSYRNIYYFTPHFTSADSILYQADQVSGFFEKNKSLYQFFIFTDDTGERSGTSFSLLATNPNVSEYPLEDNEIAFISTYSEAKKLAEETAKAIGAYDSGLRLQNNKEIDAEENNGYYSFTFLHEIYGVQYNNTDHLTERERLYRISASDPWGYEYLIIDVNKNGLVNIDWYNPYEITELLASDTPMLTFEQIMRCFTQTMLVKYDDYRNMRVWSYSDNSDEELRDGEYLKSDDTGDTYQYKTEIDSDREYLEGHINKIVLNLTRIQVGEEYLIIPVWDFYGDIYRRCTEGTITREMKLNRNNLPILTINAIDGSILIKEYEN